MKVDKSTRRRDNNKRNNNPKGVSRQNNHHTEIKDQEKTKNLTLNTTRNNIKMKKDMKNHMHNMKKVEIEIKDGTSWKDHQIHIYMDANLATKNKWNLSAVYCNNSWKIEVLNTWNQMGHDLSFEAEARAIMNSLEVASRMNVNEVEL